MNGCEWVFFAVAITCCSLSSAYFECRSDCSVTPGLECSVTLEGRNCLSTALSMNTVWPGKPEGLVIEQFVSNELDISGDVGVNISWKMPHDASAISVKGFEVSVYLLGSEVGGIRNCFFFNVTHKNGSSAISLQNLVNSVYRLQCRVPTNTDAIFTELYSLPKPKGNHMGKRVYKQVPIKRMAEPTPLPDLCKVDPEIDVNFSPQRQLIVELRKWDNKSKYHIAIMKGSFQYDAQTIQPGDSLGKQSATFEDPFLIKAGECYSIWSKKEHCEVTWTSYWKEPFCIPKTTTLKPTLAKVPDTTPVYNKSESGIPEAKLSATWIAVLSLSLIGVLCLGMFLVYCIYDKKTNHCPPAINKQVCPYSLVTSEEPEPGPFLPESNEEVEQVILFYCTTEATSKCVKKFMSFLKRLCPNVEIIDYINADRIDRNKLTWLSELKRKADYTNCRVVTIFSDGLLLLLTAESKNMYYPKYEDIEHNGEYVLPLYNAIKERLFGSMENKEILVSLGFQFASDISCFLSRYSFIKFPLVFKNENELCIDYSNIEKLLACLGVKNPKDVLSNAEAETKDLLRAVMNMLKEDGFEKYGEPVEKKNGTSLPSRASFDSQSSTMSDMERGSSGFISGFNPPAENYGAFENCPINVEFSPPDMSDSGSL